MNNFLNKIKYLILVSSAMFFFVLYVNALGCSGVDWYGCESKYIKEPTVTDSPYYGVGSSPASGGDYTTATDFSFDMFNAWDQPHCGWNGCGEVTQTQVEPVQSNDNPSLRDFGSIWCNSLNQYIAYNDNCLANNTNNDLQFCTVSNEWISKSGTCPTADSGGGQVPVLGGGTVAGDTPVKVINDNTKVVINPNVIGGYALIIDPYFWGVGGWSTAPGTLYGTSLINTPRPDFNNTGIYSNSNTGVYTNTNTNIINTTTKTMYQCPNGSLVEDYNKCPVEKCNNNALDYPTCVAFPKCTNYATNYPTCDTCPTGYDLWSAKCVAKCDQYSERNTSTGSCTYKACTNGATTAPYCNDCPNGKDFWNAKCVDSCPNNFYRNVSTGTCVELKCSNGATDYPNCATCPVSKYLQSDGVCRACDTGTTWNGHSCIVNNCNNNAINYPNANCV